LGRLQPLEKYDSNLQNQAFKSSIDGFTINENLVPSSDILNCIQDGISILDLDFNILSVNSSMQCWYSDRNKIVGEKCFKVYHNRESPCCNCPTIKVIKTGNAVVDIVPYLAPADKEKGWQQLFVFPLFDYNKKLVGVIEYVKDITIQKKLSNEILRLRKQIQALSAKNRIQELYLKQKENDKKQIEENIAYNVNKLIMPCVKQLKKNLNGIEFDSVLLLEHLINEIFSPLTKDLATRFLDLTSREIQIISLIKEGKTSKEISQLLYVSPKTVDFHRANIRKKLGLEGGKNDKKSLRAYLLAYL